MKPQLFLAVAHGSPSGHEALRTAARVAHPASGSVAVVTVGRDPDEPIES